MNVAVRVAERYLASRIVGFKPVARIIPYRFEGEVTCGFQAVPLQNAVYCPIEDFIAYDATWSEEVHGEIGDAFVFYLLGQPWFQEGAHGSPAQRTASFFDGYERSLEACDVESTRLRCRCRRQCRRQCRCQCRCRCRCRCRCQW